MPTHGPSFPTRPAGMCIGRPFHETGVTSCFLDELDSGWGVPWVIVRGWGCRKPRQRRANGCCERLIHTPPQPALATTQVTRFDRGYYQRLSALSPAFRHLRRQLTMLWHCTTLHSPTPQPKSAYSNGKTATGARLCGCTRGGGRSRPTASKLGLTPATVGSPTGV